MKVLKYSLIAMLAIVFFACQKDVKSPSLTSNAGKGSPKSTSNFGDYNIDVSVSPDGKTWTYTITKKPGAKNLSHFIIDLENCPESGQSATFANIVSATVNGEPADLTPTEGSGTGCGPTTNNFVKINFEAATQWILVITFDRGYAIDESATGWVKAGTSCNAGTIKAPGCPLTDYCSYSQGFFFANGADNNGASASWINGLTIGGVVPAYTQADGNMYWNIDQGKGGDQAMNAFFQLGAVRLSGVESEVENDAKIIDDYFMGIDVRNQILTGTNPNGTTYQYFNLPEVNSITGVTKDAAQAAGSRIGTYIDENHCP